MGVSIHADWLPLATNQSPGNACLLLQSSTQPVRQASYSMEAGHCNATANRGSKSSVLVSLGVHRKTRAKKLTYGRGGGSSSQCMRLSPGRVGRRQKSARTRPTAHTPVPHTWQRAPGQVCVRGMVGKPQSGGPGIPWPLRQRTSPSASTCTLSHLYRQPSRRRTQAGPWWCCRSARTGR